MSEAYTDGYDYYNVLSGTKLDNPFQIGTRAWDEWNSGYDDAMYDDDEDDTDYDE